MGHPRGRTVSITLFVPRISGFGMPGYGFVSFRLVPLAPLLGINNPGFSTTVPGLSFAAKTQQNNRFPPPIRRSHTDWSANGPNSLSRAIAVACSLNDRSRLDHGRSRGHRCRLAGSAARAAGRRSCHGVCRVAADMASLAASMAESLGVGADQGQNHNGQNPNRNSHHASSMTREPPGAGA